MILLTQLFDSAEICIVPDNAKTHQPKPEPFEPRRRNGVKRTTSLPMDLNFGSDRRRRRRTRRGSDIVPASRWSADPVSPPKKEKRDVMTCASTSSATSSSQSTDKLKNSMNAPPCVLRNVLKPVRQDSRENVHFSAGRAARHSLMPMMPVRQNSLRELIGSSPQKRSPKVDTVDLITQALEQLDSLSEDDEDLMMSRSPMSSSCSLPCLPTAPL